ncbi:MAG: protein kinase [Candidatus Riflebacteria bacterium]|nr:protein kinase [Candidatus Riflebacteria bacterium]
MIQKDQIVGRHYKIISKLGAGGMGQVFKALDENLGREVAIKFLAYDAAEDEDLKSRFLNEGKILATIHHPAVITIFSSEIDESLKLPFLVMELVDGQSLDKFKDDLRKDIENLLEKMITLFEGIHSCHNKGIIHRDIKPANILVNREGRLKIVDFGIAKAGPKKVTRTGIAMGTPHYMSPEQCQGKSDISSASDVYSIGVLFWEFLTGGLPFDVEKGADDPSLSIAIKHITEPPPLDLLDKEENAKPFKELLRKMLSKKPLERPSIPDILEILKRELAAKKKSGEPSSVDDENLIGDIYRIESVIGEGGMGKVFRATDTSLNRIVAIKTLHDECLKDDSLVERFIREGQLLATVGHPNVVNIYASSKERKSNKPFLVMEYIDGAPLSKLKSSLLNDKLRILPIMLQVFEGIQACHEKGIIHRDLKPSNIMVTRNGLVKLFDFGIARTAKSTTKTGMTLGTPHYMSPEQCMGAKELTAKSDVYSAGIIFWELIYGSPPYDAQKGENPEIAIAMKHVQATLPMVALPDNEIIAGLIPLVKRMLDKDPEARPTIQELISALDSIAVNDAVDSDTTKSMRRRKYSQKYASISQIFDVADAEQKQTSGGKWLAVATVVALCGGIGYYHFSGKSTINIPPVPTLPNTGTSTSKIASDTTLTHVETDTDISSPSVPAVISSEAVDLKQKEEELKKQKELEAQRELEKQKELEKQREIERQKELDRQNELEKQKELEKKIEIEKQKEAELQKEKDRVELEKKQKSEKIASICTNIETEIAKGAALADSNALKTFLAELKTLEANDKVLTFSEKLEKFFLSAADSQFLTNKQAGLSILYKAKEVLPESTKISVEIAAFETTINKEKSQQEKSEKIASASANIEAEIAKGAALADSNALKSFLAELKTLDATDKITVLSGKIEKMFLSEAESQFSINQESGLNILNKAKDVLPENSKISAKILSFEKQIKEKKSKIDNALKTLDDKISQTQTQIDPGSVVNEIKKIAKDLSLPDVEKQKLSVLYDKYHSAAMNLKDKNLLESLKESEKVLNFCKKIATATPELEAEIKEVKEKIASLTPVIDPNKPDPEQKKKLLDSAKKLLPKKGMLKEKNLAELAKLFIQLEGIGEAAAANEIRKQVVEKILLSADTVSEISSKLPLFNKALAIYPEKSPERVELNQRLEEKKAALKKTFIESLDKRVSGFVPSEKPPKELAANLKDLLGIEEKEKHDEMLKAIRGKYVEKAKELGKQSPEKGIACLDSLITSFQEMKKDQGIIDLKKSFEEKIKQTQADISSITEPLPSPDSSVNEIAEKLESLVSPEKVEKNYKQIAELIAELEKKKDTVKASEFKKKASELLSDIADEYASNKAYGDAEKLFNFALVVDAASSRAITGLKTVKSLIAPTPEPVAPTPQPEPPKPQPEPPKPPKPDDGIIFVGPGGESDISAAIAKAQAGAVIKIKPGVYKGKLSISKAVTLQGEGDKASIVIEASDGAPLTLSGSANVSNLKIKYSGKSSLSAVEISGGSPSLKSCIIESSSDAKGPDWPGVVEVSAGSPAITGNTISSSKGMGIAVKGGSPKISGNNIQSQGVYGIWFTSGGSGTAEGNTITGATRSGIGIKDGSSPTIRGNTVKASGENGILVYQQGRGVLSNNILVNNSWSGIMAMQGGTPSQISGNTISKNGRHGVHATDNGSVAIVSGDNTIDGNKGKPLCAENGGKVENK